MKKIKLLCMAMLLCSAVTQAQPGDVKLVESILNRQVEAWNRGDIHAFMEGYWKSDSLMFIGKSGVTYGWQQTLDNYKRGYPDTASMGKLAFRLLKVQLLDKNSCFVVGQWNLTRSIGNVGGHYTLLFRKIKGKWVIVADHSS